MLDPMMFRTALLPRERAIAVPAGSDAAAVLAPLVAAAAGQAEALRREALGKQYPEAGRIEAEAMRWQLLADAGAAVLRRS